MNIKSTWRAFGFFLPAEHAVHVLLKRCRDFGGVVNFSLSLLSAYFLAVLEISVCTY